MADETAIDYTPGDGDVAIELYGEGKVWLKPTLGACLLLSRSGDDGPRRLADKVLALNLDAVAIVVAAGLGRDPDAVVEAVFKSGLINLFGPCLRFVQIVMNGGRPSKKEEEKTDGDPPKSS